MKIRTQFLLILILFAVGLAFIGASVIASNRRVERVNRQIETTDAIERAIAELNYLTGDFLLYQENYRGGRWDSKFTEFSAYISELKIDEPEQAAILDNMKANRQRLKAVFGEVALALAGERQDDSMNEQAVTRVSWSRLSVQVLGLFYDATRLSHLLITQKDIIRERNHILIYALLGLLGAFFITNYFIISRRIFRSISKLQDGARVIGSGNLDYILPIKRLDEVGELGRAFNAMTFSLKTITASKAELEREIRARRKAEEEFRTTLYSIGDAVITTDTESRVWHMNPIAEALTGWKEDEARGKTLEEVFRIVNEDTRAEVENPALRVLREGVVVGLANHTVLISRNESERPIADSGAPIRGADGIVNGVVLVFRDQTEERQAQTALRESERKLRLFIENAPAAIAMFDRDMRYLFASRRWLQDYRIEIQEISGMRHYELFPDAPEWRREVHRRCLLGAVERCDEDQFPGLDGAIDWVKWECRPWHNAEGAVGGLIIMSELITERKKAEQALRESEEQYRELIQNANSAILRWTSDGNITFFNEFAQDCFGYRPEDVLGRHVGILVPHTDSNGIDLTGLAQDIVDHPERYKNTVNENICRDGRRAWMTWTNKPIFGEDGEVKEILAIGSDITELRRAEEALRVNEALARKAKAAAEAANHAKSIFLANMSHEIRTPMNGILGMADLAMMKNENPQVDEYLRFVKESGLHLLEIINDILDLSRIESGKITLARDEFSLKEFLDNTLEPFRSALDSKPIAFKLEIDCAIPDRVTGDPGRLRQVLVNLIGNAVKFTEQGEIALFVQVDEAQAEENRIPLLFIVRDTGIGIPAGHLERIFESFEQVHSPLLAKYEGTGLGLSISKNLVQLMGGSIWVESREGVGSTFFFTTVLAIPPREMVNGEAIIGIQSVCRPLRILVAEDNRVNQIYIETMLKKEGHMVSIAKTGLQVLEMLAEENFDLVLMDIRMPEMSGDDAVRIIRNNPPPGVDSKIPVVALTAYALETERERFMDCGFDGYLTKPIEIEKLFKMLSELG